MRLFELAYCCRLYEQLSDSDKAINRLLKETGARVDLTIPSHRAAIFQWLKDWQCRIADALQTAVSESLLEWANTWLSNLPKASAQLDELSSSDLDTAARAYHDLTRIVGFGPTIAAKVLYAVRPHAFIPWDEAIRNGLCYDGSAKSYRAYLDRVISECGAVAEEAGIAVADLPVKVERPQSSTAKLIDEYYYVVFTRNCKPPSVEKLKEWCSWVK